MNIVAEQKGCFLCENDLRSKKIKEKNCKYCIRNKDSELSRESLSDFYCSMIKSIL
jgi:hypothetical protein